VPVRALRNTEFHRAVMAGSPDVSWLIRCPHFVFWSDRIIATRISIMFPFSSRCWTFSAPSIASFTTTTSGIQTQRRQSRDRGDVFQAVRRAVRRKEFSVYFDLVEAQHNDAVMQAYSNEGAYWSVSLFRELAYLLDVATCKTYSPKITVRTLSWPKANERSKSPLLRYEYF